ncbi:anti-sigma-I factor RsgI family protein [Peribacillus frigoritolerans]|uniref:anti-sigma-I factor RsgI family protein n=1 Tax=Peribacillus frigoritolerans TaxID=450367 RepID=UPI00105A958D|nr:anti-sigma factor domain-containing protein [Peribacillus frigoritolerans]TDL80259.1 anti-sigma factor domain-containing protein [Peribacillus frigoritolerans]
MKKGIVVDRNDDYVTLLTPDGQFLKANKQKRSYELGEEITFFQLSDTSERAKSLSIFNLSGMRNGLLAVMAIILLFFTVLPVFKDDKVYAYMTIDINPSFELRLNEKLQVVQIEPMNEDGERMLDDIKDWKNRKISDVFTKIVDKSKDLGYLKGDKEIFITTVTTDDKHESAKKKMLADVDELKHSYESENVKVNSVEADVEIRKKAADQGISTGKYIQLNPKPAETPPSNENKGDKAEGKQETPHADEEEKDKETPPALKPPAEETEKQAPPEKPAKREKPEIKEEELKETIPEKKKVIPEPPKDKVSIKDTDKEAEKAKKEAEKKRREDEKGKWQREDEKGKWQREDRDDEDEDDDDDRQEDRRDKNWGKDQDDRDRDDEDEDEDEDDEGSRSDRD